jgi:hypothetical protein
VISISSGSSPSCSSRKAPTSALYLAAVAAPSSSSSSDSSEATYA